VISVLVVWPSMLNLSLHRHQDVQKPLVVLQDLQLDNPDAAHLLSLFLGRAIVDEAMAPSFLANVLPTLEDHSEGVNVVQSTGDDLLHSQLLNHISHNMIMIMSMLAMLSFKFHPLQFRHGQPAANASNFTPYLFVAGAILSARHAAERLQNCWHGGSQTIDQLRNRMQVRLCLYSAACNETCHLVCPNVCSSGTQQVLVTSC